MGMAVDANVLIYERIREEQRNGRSIMASIDTGFRRAMATIIDANMTHLIASLILFELGSGPVRGFAVTLGVGIITVILHRGDGDAADRDDLAQYRAARSNSRSEIWDCGPRARGPRKHAIFPSHL